MTHWTTPRASLAGISVFVLGQALYVAFSNHEPLRLILLCTPGFAALISAYLAPHWKIFIGMSMAIYGTMIGELMACIYEYFGGHVDHIGDTVATFIILFTYNTILSIIGSILGIVLSQKIIGSYDE